MKFNLLNLLCLTSVVSGAFLYYDTIHLGLSALYAYIQPNAPIAVDVVYWGLFVEALDCTFDKAIDFCQTCKTKYEERNWDCIRVSTDLAVSVVTNVISLYIGCQLAGTSNGSLKSRHTTVLKKGRYLAIMITGMLVLGYLIVIKTGWLLDGVKYLTHLLPNIHLKN